MYLLGTKYQLLIVYGIEVPNPICFQCKNRATKLIKMDLVTVSHLLWLVARCKVHPKQIIFKHTISSILYLLTSLFHKVTACGKNEYWYIDVRNLIGTRESPLTERLL